jgi:DNA-binding response OmpR family regulator
MIEHSFEANIVLYGLSDELATDLSAALGRFCEGFQTQPIPDSAQALHEVHRMDVDLVFCKPVPSLIRRLRAANPSASIIAVGRFPETSDWIDSIEAGADDYCAAPFETAQLRWMFESCLRYARAAA